MSWTEITVLVERAKLGDREAYGELVVRFQSSVYAMALARVRDPLEAQELAQDVFVHAMRKLPQLRDARCFAGWLRRITARMAINRLTRRGPLFGADPEVLEGVVAVARTAEAQAEVGEAVEQLKDGLADLKALDRQTLEAFYLRGRSLSRWPASSASRPARSSGGCTSPGSGCGRCWRGSTRPWRSGSPGTGPNSAACDVTPSPRTPVRGHSDNPILV
jgi:RNA polymerase sigma-70 factor (ECF subfamily)